MPDSNNIIRHANDSHDPASAEQAIREIDLLLHSETNAQERAGLLMNKAVLYGVLKRFDDARAELARALQDSDDPDTRLIHDYIDGTLYHQEKRQAEAFRRLTEVTLKYAARLKCPDMRSTYEDIQTQRAFEAADLKNYGDAVPLLTEILSFELTKEDKATALAYLGLSCYQTKRYEAAREYLLLACALEQPPKWRGMIHLYLALAYAQLRLLEESRQQLLLCEEHAAEWGLSIRNVYGWLSRICGYLGETLKAKEYGRLAKGN